MGFVESLMHTVRDRVVIIDVRNVTLLESTAIVALRELFDAPPGTHRQIFLSGASANVRQMFRMAGLGTPTSLMSDRDLLARIAGEEPNHG